MEGNTNGLSTWVCKGKNEGTSEFRVNEPCCLGNKEEVGVGEMITCTNIYKRKLAGTRRDEVSPTPLVYNLFLEEWPGDGLHHF